MRRALPRPTTSHAPDELHHPEDEEEIPREFRDPALLDGAIGIKRVNLPTGVKHAKSHPSLCWCISLGNNTEL